MNRIAADRAALAAWLATQPPALQAIGATIVGHLGAAQIGARTDRTIKRLLIADIAKLTAAARRGRQRGMGT